ncbi:hypothetical protein [Bacillus sp. ISL-7]|uniref:hypothetical protein n=1 Tax=Bacillus sp. ISL-7 TaxID=2819136 RepID=UPI001BEBDD19|nr:hypothetical protein [Bacillus sp. ISL-7]MBT2735167.1 hypothetical protein [Bacillus sp. ISL-7]
METQEETEWKFIEEYYLARLNKEKEQKELAHGLVKSLTATINKKNTEIETLNFCINTLASALKASCEAVHKLKELEKAK